MYIEEQLSAIYDMCVSDEFINSLCIVIIQNFEKIILIDSERAIQFSSKYLTSHFSALISLFPEDKQLRFRLMEAFFTNDDVHLFSQTEIVTEYLHLLAAFKKNMVLQFLKKHSSFAIDGAFLAIFQTYGIIDAQVFLLESQGQIIKALDILLNELRNLCTESNRQSQTEQLRLCIRNIYSLCLRQNIRETSGLWFSALDSFLFQIGMLMHPSSS